MQIKAPPGITAVSVAGREYRVFDGSLDLPEELAMPLLDHGFVRVSAKDAPKPVKR